jgi:hypothetical protein
VFTFYNPTAHSFKHTYQESLVPGTLITERWTFRFFEVALYALLILIPFTGAFMLASPRDHGRMLFHLILVVILFFWMMALLVIGGIDWTRANNVDTGNFDNPANDPRWCCIHYALPGAPCENTAACVPAVGTADLIVNRLFLFQFWFNVAFILLLVVDFAVTLGPYRYGVRALEDGDDSDAYIPLNRMPRRLRK